MTLSFRLFYFDIHIAIKPKMQDTIKITTEWQWKRVEHERILNDDKKNKKRNKEREK